MVAFYCFLYRIADVSKGDVLLDLGCGDGRVLLAAARLGAQGIGYELDKQLADQARQHVSADLKYGSMIRIEQGDAHKAKPEDVAAATVLALYLSETGNRKLVTALGQNLRPGARLVSYCFAVEGWERSLVKRDEQDNLPVFLYRVPDAGKAARQQ